MAQATHQRVSGCVCVTKQDIILQSLHDCVQFLVSAAALCECQLLLLKERIFTFYLQDRSH